MPDALGRRFLVPREQKIAIDVGRGTNYSTGADSLFVRYNDALSFPNFPQVEGFYDVSAGTWRRRVNDSSVALAIGVRERWDNFHLDGSVGLAVMAGKTANSDTYQQFALRVGAGYRVRPFDFGLYRMHFSNNKPFFDWEGRNIGYDFVVFEVGYLLK